MATNDARRPAFRCSECGWRSVRWVGRCGECQAWGSVGEVGGPASGGLTAGPVSGAARPMTAVDPSAAAAVPTGLFELDRVLGGGLVPGAVLLLAGEPGVGKSTLLLQVAAMIAQRGARALYVTGEESAEQVRGRAERVGAVHEGVLLAAEADVAAVVAHTEAVEPALLVVDSIQTITTAEVDGVRSGVSQVRESAAALIRLAKSRQLATILVGHVTKDGAIAGPRTLEHLVDVVLSFEGDRHSRLRLVRAVKNRYGPTDEIGCFELDESGLTELRDPTGLFVTHRASPVPGTCLTVALEGRRPLLTEVQALVVPNGQSSPRRTTAGMDGARIAMVLAVLERRQLIPMSRFDTYVAPVGGARVTEPGSDLAVALAVYGSTLDLSVPLGWVALGEIGLAGEVRRLPGARRRLAEAARLGITHAVVARGELADLGDLELTVHAVDDVGDALRVVPWVRAPEVRGDEIEAGPRALRLIRDPA
jgi:DNA repair protein RadA/Sms